MHFFYYTGINDKYFQTTEEESKHIARVLRMMPGEDANFTDGTGNLFTCRLIDAHPKRCIFEVLNKLFFPLPHPQLHVAVAPTKNISRMEWFIEKATEIGIGEITPIRCTHSERVNVNRDRLEKIAVAALKQSQQVWLPKINELANLNVLMAARSEDYSNKFIAYVSKDHLRLLKHEYTPEMDALILIGPEGDFSVDEIKSALQHGFKPISLGEHRLRTETAALVACHTIVLSNQ